MKFFAKVYVTPKSSVLDPQGKTVAASLHTLGYPEVEEVRMGRYVEIRFTAVDVAQAQTQVDRMCSGLLANEVIENYRFEIEEEPA